MITFNNVSDTTGSDSPSVKAVADSMDRDRTRSGDALGSSLYQAAAFSPRSLQFPNAWVGHLPFASWLIRQLSPKIFVELGTHSGNSYFSFCQAVVESGMTAHTRCYAVDTWRGDEHAGNYADAVFEKVNAYHEQLYTEFSRLLRMTFDEATGYFSNRSVNLLHIDGLHTYNAVRHDFESWLPKLAPGAVVLFHDTNVRERNFGVWKYWEELQKRYPWNIEFVHSHGLCVLQLDDVPESMRLEWLRPGAPLKRALIDYFSALGSRQTERYAANELRDRESNMSRLLAERDGQIARTSEGIVWRDGQITHLSEGVAQRDQKIGEQERRLVETAQAFADAKQAYLQTREVLAANSMALEQVTARLRDTERVLNELRTSNSWRLTLPLRELRRWASYPRVQARKYTQLVFPTRQRGAAMSAPARLSLTSQSGQSHGLPSQTAPPADAPDDSGHPASAGVSSHAAGDSQAASPTNTAADAAAMLQRVNPAELFDPEWYLRTNPDVQAAGLDPLQHFLDLGWREGRNPHPHFDVRFYQDAYPDVREASINPLLHYLGFGAAELRDPNPQFDAAFYVAQHPEAAGNPLLYHLRRGAPRGYRTRASRAQRISFSIDQYLPGVAVEPPPPTTVPVDVVVPVYRGLEETRRCLESLLADNARPAGRLRVIDDCSPEPELSAYLAKLAADRKIDLTRNQQNQGFVRTVMQAMKAAGRHDVLLLNSDTEISPGFLRRMAAHAYSRPKVGTVTPFSNSGGEMCGFPSTACQPLPQGYTARALDNACVTANSRRAIEIPTGVGFCLYIRRDCLDDVGPFDSGAFGRGYGEETDFCQRALAKGWHHLLACDTFVYHTGEVSFGQNAPERASSWTTLVERYPELPAVLREHLSTEPTKSAIFAATVALFGASDLPTRLILNHAGSEQAQRHVQELTAQAAGAVNLISLFPIGADFELSIPTIPGHPTLTFPSESRDALLTLLRACSISRVHVQHWVGFDADLHRLVNCLGAPVDLTLHDQLTT